MKKCFFPTKKISLNLEGAIFIWFEFFLLLWKTNDIFFHYKSLFFCVGFWHLLLRKNIHQNLVCCEKRLSVTISWQIKTSLERIPSFCHFKKEKDFCLLLWISNKCIDAIFPDIFADFKIISIYIFNMCLSRLLKVQTQCIIVPKNLRKCWANRKNVLFLCQILTGVQILAFSRYSRRSKTYISNFNRS